MIRMQLPWPAKELSPNARVHWAVKSGKTAKARQDARLLCRAAMPSLFGGWSRQYKATVRFTFHPADSRRRDLDNLISSTKAARDGIADAIGVDDSNFKLTAEMGEVRKPACVVVEIS